MKKVEPFSVPSKKVELPAKKSEPAAAEEDEDDDIDLFGSDDEEEDQEAAKVREERLRQYAEKKAKKPGLIAKSSILLDVKPVSGLWEFGSSGSGAGNPLSSKRMVVAPVEFQVRFGARWDLSLWKPGMGLDGWDFKSHLIP